MAPGAVLTPIALDLDRAWIVLPDGGPSLGERFGKPGLHSGELVEMMMKVLPQYGQFQRNVSGDVERLLAVGVPDMRAEVMPERFDQALAFVTDDVERRHSFADRTTIGRLGDFRDTYVSWCLRLAEAPGGASLDHNELDGDDSDFVDSPMQYLGSLLEPDHITPM